MKQSGRLIFAVAGVLALSGAARAEVKMSMGMMGGGDAKITKEQFLKQAEERFARMDANNDGVIGPDDRQKMHARMKECRQMMGDMRMMRGSGMDRKGDRAGKPADERSAHHPTL